MREYGQIQSAFWQDHNGRQWHVTTSRRRLKFKIPCHAAIRAFVFHRDGYRCQRCPAIAINVPADYDGRYALFTNTKNGNGFTDVLVMDHVLTLKAGGLNHPSNMQALCETCNKRKQIEDKAAAESFRRLVA